jgi:methylenetetrahydrofolate dehydrogenase (NADP+)/methenyltetrahydrofolate cyclohydrolase
VAEIAGAITPVPGGVGPMTIACLMLNTLKAACAQNGLPPPIA